MDIKDRLLAKRVVNTITGCWLYTGPRIKGRKGELKYGQIKYKGKNVSVHRLALQVFKEIVFLENEQANHIIECPYMHCFNPDHLYKGTQKENMQDRKKSKPKKTRKQKNAEYYARHNQHREDWGRAKL